MKTGVRFQSLIGALLIGLAASLATGIIGARIPVISQMEFHAFDALMRNRTRPEKADLDKLPMLVVEATPAEVLPFRKCRPSGCTLVPREYTAAAIRRLIPLRPSVIALDIYLDESRPVACLGPNASLRQAMIKAIEAGIRVVLTGQVSSEQGLIRPSETALPAGADITRPMVARPYNRCRAVPLVKSDPQLGPVPSFALDVFLRWKSEGLNGLNAAAPTEIQAGDSRIPTLEREVVRLSPFPAWDVADIAEIKGSGLGPGDHLMLVNWFGGIGEFKSRSLDYLKTLPDGYLGGKVVVVGSLSEPQYPTPIGNLRGFEIQANAIATLLSGKPVQPLSSQGGFLLTWALASLVAVAARHGGVFAGLGTWLALGAFNIVAAMEAMRSGLWVYTVFPSIGGLAAYTLAVSLEQERVQRLLQGFIPAPLRKRETGSYEEATVFVADIRGYSDVADQVGPDSLFAYINRYYSVTEAALIAYGGHLVQSEGDKVVAFFSGAFKGRSHAQNAVAASLDLLKRLEEAMKSWDDPAGGPFRIGIGISTGPCVVAILGKRHRDAALLGNTVNIASHLEGLTKIHACPLLLDARTSLLLNGSFPIRQAGETMLKWTDRKVAYYCLADLRYPTSPIRKGIYDDKESFPESP